MEDNELEAYQPTNEQNNNSDLNKSNSSTIDIINEDINTQNKINYNENNIEQQNINNENSFEVKEKKVFPKTIIYIGLGIVFLIGIIILIIFLINKSQNSEKYQELLANAATTYYQKNNEKLPTDISSCNFVTLNELIDAKLVTDTTLNEKCNKTSTIVKVCKLESGNYQYIPTLTCDKKKLTTVYDDWSVGTESNLIKNESDVNYKYSILKTNIKEETSSIEEKFFENEIPYEIGSYTITDEKTVYRSRTKTLNWYTELKYYYPNDYTIESKVNEYYVSAPNSTYNNKGNSSTVYKWLIGQHLVYNDGEYVSEGIYPYTIKGEEGTSKVWASVDYPSEKGYRTVNNAYIYRSRKLESTDLVVDIEYHCRNTVSGNNWYSEDSCDADISEGIEIIGYKCEWKNNVSNKQYISEEWQTNECSPNYYYVNGNVNDGYSNAWSPTDCGYNPNVKPYLCDRRMGYVITDKVWKWYTPSERTYYKTNNVVSYYKDAPSAQAIKDSTTSTTAYTWYKTVRKNLGTSPTAPVAGAKSYQTFTEWSVWNDTPITSSNDIQVEQKKQITLKKTTFNDTDWVEISNGYVSLDDAISLLKEQGYNINSLEDINYIENLKYKIQLYYRNPK